MCLCVETIRIADGRWPEAEILHLHQERIARTCRGLYGGAEVPDLTAIRRAHPVPEDLREGVAKCRVVYGVAGGEAVEYSRYTPPRIGSLLAVEVESFDYGYKYADRRELTVWHEQALAKGYGDALLIRDGLVTDTTFCNVAFRVAGGSCELWHTPASPLLRGTMREWLIKRGTIVPREIRLENLRGGHYSHIALFNAMNDFGTLLLPIDRICY
ncbi:aminotransferase class IV [uncultured Rikenella sp.]|uniref:aminotransferase class IV n=1 Tax=uncultured Rikenella sp. TaxID=368003 RepID=UPI0026271369|nr:aminotransferase class IV [uncultured Rikenella sp.]